MREVITKDCQEVAALHFTFIGICYQLHPTQTDYGSHGNSHTNLTVQFALGIFLVNFILVFWCIMSLSLINKNRIHLHVSPLQTRH